MVDGMVVGRIEPEVTDAIKPIATKRFRYLGRVNSETSLRF